MSDLANLVALILAVLIVGHLVVASVKPETL